jgi:hypothetical protein
MSDDQPMKMTFPVITKAKSEYNVNISFAPVPRPSSSPAILYLTEAVIQALVIALERPQPVDPIVESTTDAPIAMSLSKPSPI